MSGFVRRAIVVTEFNPNHKDKWTAWFEDRRKDFIGFGDVEAEATAALYECVAVYEKALRGR